MHIRRVLRLKWCWSSTSVVVSFLSSSLPLLSLFVPLPSPSFPPLLLASPSLSSSLLPSPPLSSPLLSPPRSFPLLPFPLLTPLSSFNAYRVALVATLYVIFGLVWVWKKEQPFPGAGFWRELPHLVLVSAIRNTYTRGNEEGRDLEQGEKVCVWTRNRETGRTKESTGTGVSEKY